MAILIILLPLLFVMAPSISLGQEVPRFDLFGGYSYLRLDTPSIGFADFSNLNGFNAGAAVNLTGGWAVVADASGHYGSRLDAYNFMAGPQYSWRKERSRFFAQVLFGKAQNTVHIATQTQNGFESVGRAIAAGGGFDLDVTHRFTFRVVQADYLNTHTFNNSQNNIRVSTGLVVHFGHIGKRRKP